MSQSLKPRVYLASFLASFAASLPTIIWCFYVAVTAGPDDDGAIRGIAALFIAFPFIYLLFALICYVLGTTFVSHGFTSLRRFLLATVFAFLAFELLACLLFVKAPDADSLILIAWISCYALVSALFASICWWFVAVRPFQIELTRDAMSSKM